MTIDEYDFVEACIDIAHESYHVATIQQSSGISSDLLESYVSRFNNNETYKSEYDRFSYEIAAERYALKTVQNYMNKAIPVLQTDAIMLDYVNAKAMSDNKEYSYFIHTKTGFTSMQEVFDALDEAYEKSFETKKNFDVEGNHIHETLASDDKLKQGFDRASDGREQTKFAAIINLQDDTSLFRTFKSLKSEDYDLQQIYDNAPIANAKIRKLQTDRELPHVEDVGESLENEDLYNF